MKNKKLSLFKKWLLIEVIFFVIILFVTIGIFLYSGHHIKEQLQNQHINNLSITKTQIEGIFNSGKYTASKYSIHPKVRVLLQSDYSELKREYSELVDDIKQTNASEDGISEVIIYLKTPDIYISSAGIMDSQVFNQVYSSGEYRENNIENIDAENFSTSEIIPIFYGISQNEIYTGMLIKEISEDSFVYVIFDAEYINNILNLNTQNENNSFSIQNTEFKNIFTINKNLNFEKEVSQIPEKIRVEDTVFYILQDKSDEYNLIYSSYICSECYLSKYIDIQKISLIILITTIILGLISSYLLTKYKYTPVKRVMDYSKNITPVNILLSSENELDQIKKTIEFVHSQNEVSKTLLTEHNEHIKENALKMILEGELEYKDITEHIKGLLDMNTTDSYTLAIAETKQSFNESDVFKELPNLIHIIKKAGRLIMLFSENSKSTIILLKKSNLINSMDIFISVSKTRVGADSLKISYREALQNLSRKIIPGTGKIIPPVNKNSEKILTISTENEINLCGYIQSSNKDDAVSLFENMTIITKTSSIDIFSYKSYLYSISGAIIRSAENILDEATIHSLLSKFDSAFLAEDFDEISKTLKESIIMLCERYESKKNSSNIILKKRIVEYIEININNDQLSSEMIADDLLINPAYLRRFFKEQNGITLWDYINMRRVEMARTLLTTTTTSIKDICSKTGYISISTFSRTFKKFTGMTPGHYRELKK